MKVHSWTYKKCMKDQILKFRNGSNYSSINLLILSISIDNGRIKIFSFRFDFFKPHLPEHCTIIIIIIIFALFIQYRWKYINNIFYLLLALVFKLIFVTTRDYFPSYKTILMSSIRNLFDTFDIFYSTPSKITITMMPNGSLILSIDSIKSSLVK